MSTSRRFSFESSSSKTLTIDDLVKNFHSIVGKLKKLHDKEVESLQFRVEQVESENRMLRAHRDTHPHSIFDIDYVSPESVRINELTSQLERAKAQITVLQDELNEKASEYRDMRSKYDLQVVINKDKVLNQSSVDTNQIKELENRLEKIREQVQQFDQSNFETEEQIRLLKEILFTTDQQNKTIAQSLTVKKSDLAQQTKVVQNTLQKNHDKILARIAEIFEENLSSNPTNSNKNNKTKKKRL